MFRAAALILALFGIAVSVLAIQVTRLAFQTARSVEQTALAIRRMMMERASITLEIPLEGAKVIIEVYSTDPDVAVPLMTKLQRGVLAGLAQVTQEQEGER